jgi:hypothetical protein
MKMKETPIIESIEEFEDIVYPLGSRMAMREKIKGRLVEIYYEIMLYRSKYDEEDMETWSMFDDVRNGLRELIMVHGYLGDL